MKWDSRNGCPEPRLVQNIEKCDEEDLGEMFSRTSSQFAGKFVEFVVLTGGDSLRKFENFMKGTEYKRILNKRTLEDEEIEVEEEPDEISKKKPTEIEPTESIKAPPLSSKAIKEVMEW